MIIIIIISTVRIPIEELYSRDSEWALPYAT